MKTVRKIMIGLGVVLIVGLALEGCKKKSEEEKSETKTEKKKEKKVKIGKPFTLWAFDEKKEKEAQFSITFERFSFSKQHPTRRRPTGRNPTGLRWVDEPIMAPEGEKYFIIYASVENLGPRPSIIWGKVEYKIEKEYIYPISNIELVKTLVEWEDSGSLERIGGDLGPGEKGWLILYTLIPEERIPFELFGILDSLEYFTKDREMLGVRFRLSLPREKTSTSLRYRNNDWGKNFSSQEISKDIKCPKCGLVFSKGSIPNDFPDRCPKCGYSRIEEKRKK